MVAGEHRTDIPQESGFMGVISIDSVRVASFIEFPYQMMANAEKCYAKFLYGLTTEKFYNIANPEFGGLKG